MEILKCSSHSSIEAHYLSTESTTQVSEVHIVVLNCQEVKLNKVFNANFVFASGRGERVCEGIVKI